MILRGFVAQDYCIELNLIEIDDVHWGRMLYGQEESWLIELRLINK